MRLSISPNRLEILLKEHPFAWKGMSPIQIDCFREREKRMFSAD